MRPILPAALMGLSLLAACQEHESPDATNTDADATATAKDFDGDGYTDGYDNTGNLADGVVGPLLSHPYWDQHFVLVPFDAYVTDESVWDDWPVVVFDNGSGPQELPLDETYYYCELADGEWCHPYDEFVAIDTHEMGTGVFLVWLESGTTPGVNALDINDTQSALVDPLFWRTDDGGKLCVIRDSSGIHGKTAGACDGIAD